MKETRYGFISDIHGNPAIVDLAVGKLTKLGIERLVLNGDLGNMQRDLADSQSLIGAAIVRALSAGLMTYVQPGSHESIAAYAPIVRMLGKRHDNLVSTLENPKVEEEDHDLVFLPGSDWVCDGEYMFGTKFSTGYKVITKKEDISVDTIHMAYELAKRLNGRMLHYNNVDDLKKLVTRPDRTIVVCHVPRKFDNIETCVDMADFAEGEGGVVMPASFVRMRIKQDWGEELSDDEVVRIAADNGFTFKKENRGNADLTRIYEELGIRKAVSGHFHESSHRANDRESKHVLEGTYVDELFWNSGCVSQGFTGVLTVREDGKVKYANIGLKD